MRARTYKKHTSGKQPLLADNVLLIAIYVSLYEFNCFQNSEKTDNFGQIDNFL